MPFVHAATVPSLLLRLRGLRVNGTRIEALGFRAQVLEVFGRTSRLSGSGSTASGLYGFRV